jgi:N utilization substance protein B
VTAGPRRQAREAALAVLYLHELGGVAPALALETYFAEHQPDATSKVRALAGTMANGVVGDLEAIDRLIGAHATNWRLERLAVIDRWILRIGIWELRAGTAEPAVVINEALELARRFSADEAVPFVNGVLDAVHRTLARPAPARPSEE